MAAAFITGSWIDVVHPCPRDGVYWNRRTLAYTDEDWAVLIRHLRRDLGLELLMLQCVAKDGLSVYPSRVMQEPLEKRWYTRNCYDPLGAILKACSAEGMDFYMGVGFIPGELDSGRVQTGDEAMRWYEAVSAELLDRFGGEAGWKGWYMAAEMSVVQGKLEPAQTAFAGRLTAMWRRLTPKWPAIASPYFLHGQRRLDDCDDNVRRVEETGLTAIAYQDGIGLATAVQVPGPPDPLNNERLFATARRVHDHTGVALWANTELFCFENEIFFQPLIPASFERIEAQVRLAAPHVERVVAYTVPGLMTSQRVCPGLGVPQTEELYLAYTVYRKGMNAKEG